MRQVGLKASDRKCASGNQNQYCKNTKMPTAAAVFMCPLRVVRLKLTLRPANMLPKQCHTTSSMCRKRQTCVYDAMRQDGAVFGHGVFLFVAGAFDQSCSEILDLLENVFYIGVHSTRHAPLMKWLRCAASGSCPAKSWLLASRSPRRLSAAVPRQRPPPKTKPNRTYMITNHERMTNTLFDEPAQAMPSAIAAPYRTWGLKLSANIFTNEMQ